MRFETVFCIDGSGEKKLKKAEAKRPIYRVDVKKRKIMRPLLENEESGLSFFTRQFKYPSVPKPILIAADCPIGLPVQPRDVYGRNQTFLEWLESKAQRLPNQEAWRDRLIAKGIGDRSKSKPFVEHRKGEEKKEKIYGRRKCDEESKGESVYFLLGSKQVGKAALQFWFEVLQPLRERFQNRLAVWSLESLRNRDVVVAECYPALYVKPVYGSRISNKRNKTEREKALSRLLDDNKTRCEVTNKTWDDAASSDHSFDMFTTAYYILQEMEKGRENILSYPKKNLECETVEGWMLGLRP